MKNVSEKAFDEAAATLNLKNIGGSLNYYYSDKKTPYACCTVNEDPIKIGADLGITLVDEEYETKEDLRIKLELERMAILAIFDVYKRTDSFFKRGKFRNYITHLERFYQESLEFSLSKNGPSELKTKVETNPRKRAK